MQGIRGNGHSLRCPIKNTRSTTVGKIQTKVVFLEEASLPQSLRRMLETLDSVDDG